MGVTDLHRNQDQLLPSDAWRAIKPRQRKWIDAYLKLGTFGAADKEIGWGNGAGKRHMEKNPVMRAAYDVRRQAWEKLGLLGAQRTRMELEQIAYAEMGVQRPTFDHKLNALDKLAKIDGMITNKTHVTGEISLLALVRAATIQGVAPTELPAQYAPDVPLLEKPKP